MMMPDQNLDFYGRDDGLNNGGTGIATGEATIGGGGQYGMVFGNNGPLHGSCFISILILSSLFELFNL